MKRTIVLVLVLLCLSAAFASQQEVEGWVQDIAEHSETPEGLSEHEIEIYQQGYAAGYSEGYYKALHPVSDDGHYTLNIKSMKFHLPSCNGVAAMNPENRKEFYGTREEVMLKGYSPCGLCDP